MGIDYSLPQNPVVPGPDVQGPRTEGNPLQPNQPSSEVPKPLYSQVLSQSKIIGEKKRINRPINKKEQPPKLSSLPASLHSQKLPIYQAKHTDVEYFGDMEGTTKKSTHIKNKPRRGKAKWTTARAAKNKERNRVQILNWYDEPDYLEAFDELYDNPEEVFYSDVPVFQSPPDSPDFDYGYDCDYCGYDCRYDYNEPELGYEEDTAAAEEMWDRYEARYYSPATSYEDMLDPDDE